MEQRQMRRGPVQPFREVLLAHRVHRLRQRVRQLQSKDVDELLFSSGIGLVFVAGHVFRLLVPLIMALRALSARTPGSLGLTIGCRLWLSRIVALLWRRSRRSS